MTRPAAASHGTTPGPAGGACPGAGTAASSAARPGDHGGDGAVRGVWGVAFLPVKGDNHVARFLVAATTLNYFLVLRIAGTRMRASEHDKRSAM